MNRRTGRSRRIRGATAAGIAPMILLVGLTACDSGGAISSPEPFDFSAAKRGGPGGGGGTPLVELTDGVLTLGQQEAIIVTDNRRRLTLDTPSEGGGLYASAFDLTATHAAGLGNCVLNGAFEGVLTPQDLLDIMVEANRPRDFTLYIDKDDAAAGAVSDYQQLKQTWRTDSPSLRFVTFIGFKNKRARLPGVSDPVVTAADLGGGTTQYTFQNGTGIVAIDELHESVGILCALLDDVEVRATITP